MPLLYLKYPYTVYNLNIVKLVLGGLTEFSQFIWTTNPMTGTGHGFESQLNQFNWPVRFYQHCLVEFVGVSHGYWHIVFLLGLLAPLICHCSYVANKQTKHINGKSVNFIIMAIPFLLIKLKTFSSECNVLSSNLEYSDLLAYNIVLQ
jgi:hypothetical protein